MVIPVSLFIAAAFAIFSYSQGQGGPVAGLVFFGILFLGVLINATQPLRDKVKPHLPSRPKR
jgi:hypothetical protein